MNNSHSTQRTTISIKPDTKARLDEIGRKNESYDILVNRLIGGLKN